MRKLRDRFEDCYTAVPVPDNSRKGFKMKYIYYAPWYVWDMEENLLRNQKWALLMCSVAGAGINVLSAMQKSPQNKMVVLFLIFTLSLCCHVMEFRGLLQFLLAKYRTTKMTYEDVNRILLTAPILRAALSGVLVIACVFGAVTGGGMLSGVTALGYALSAVTAIWVYRRYSRIPLRVVENDTLDQYKTQQNKEGS